MTSSNDILRLAVREHFAVPAFNIPYLPMIEPTVAALRDADAIGMIAVARLEWEKFGAISLEAVRDEYEKHKVTRFTRLHLDHVPVIDEDNLAVDYMALLTRAVEVGYDSVMVDASRLPLADNIAATREVVELAHTRGIPVEAELGAVLGHESGPLPPYEELFASGRGFTDPDELERFVAETGVDWMSVAVGSIHGAISEAARGREKPSARLDLNHLEKLHARVTVPLVLHGGTGIPQDYILGGIQRGIAKINIGHATRTAYLRAMESGNDPAQAVYDAATAVLRGELQCAGTASRI